MKEKTIDAVAFGSCYVDTNLAQYPFADEGIPPEVELVGEQYETVLGGSAVNFCVLLQSLGAKTAFVGVIGADPNGEVLTELLEKQGIEPALITRPDVQTNTGFNMTNPNGKHIMLVAGSANATLSPEIAMPKLEGLLPEAKMLYLGGCFKLKAFFHAFPELVELAKRHDADIAIDHNRIPQGTSPEMLQAVKELVLKADYYFPSRAEFCELWGVKNIEEGLKLLHQKAPALITIAKDGDNGAFYMAEGEVRHVEAPKVETVLNATGAGDTFNAGVIATISQDRPLDEAIAYGCRVAAARVGGQTPLSL